MESLYLNAINLFGKLGPQKVTALLALIPSFEEIWKAERSLLEQTRFGSDVIDEFIAFRKTVDPEIEYKKLEHEGIRMVLFHSPLNRPSLLPSFHSGQDLEKEGIQEKSEYPPLLKEIYSPPTTLYVRGTLPDPSLPTLAIVGSRKISSYGTQVAPELAGALADAGVVIVSGLALGVDSLAHQAAVERNQPTIAVLGCSINDSAIYPTSNRYLSHRILDTNGALISEYPLGVAPLKHHFPARNRMISGMSLGVLIIEASSESGSLLTARHALDQNREVFAVPGSIYSLNCEGTNNLIKMGAHCVTSTDDILDALNISSNFKRLATDMPMIADTYEESLILPHLSKSPIHIDELGMKSTLDLPTLSATLTLMEMKGSIRNLGAMMYVRTR